MKRFYKASRLGRRYSMVTAYDAPTAEILAACGVDLLLVGDSVGMVVLGYPNTVSVTMDEMIHHAKAVRRGAPKSFLIADLPKKGIEKGPAQALDSSRRFLKEAGADAVKIEWNSDCLKSTALLAKNKIFVQAHIGLTPQLVTDPKGFKVQGRDGASAAAIYHQALALEQAGARMLLLECIPWQLARQISRKVSIPTIGIGAGPHCDGQVLVFHDLVGLYDKMQTRFVKRYAHTAKMMRRAVGRYSSEVRLGKFPGDRHSFAMKEREYQGFLHAITREGCLS